MGEKAEKTLFRSSMTKRTPRDFQKSLGVISLFFEYQIYTFADSRGRLSLQEIANFLMRSPLYASAFNITLLQMRILQRK